MKKILCSWIIYLLTTSVSIHAQELLPKSMTKYEKAILDTYLSKFSKKTVTNPPNFPVRTMAEWEEVQAICVTWTGYKSILAQIIEEVQSECEVIVLCSNANTAQTELQNYGVSLSNVTFVPANFNSI